MSASPLKTKKRRLKEAEEEAPRDNEQPITSEGERPQKRFYRQRAHCNPLAHNDSYEYPIRPADMDWYGGEGESSLYPKSMEDVPKIPPTVLDIGCGFGGLTLALAAVLPEETILGLEIRAKVTEYVRLRIVAARNDPAAHHINPHALATSIPISDTTPAALKPTLTGALAKESSAAKEYHHYKNCAVLRTNSMKFLPNYFEPMAMQKLFFCFPDPHFKRKNHPRRIISYRLLDEYAYVLQPGPGKLYCITDVEELHDWHVAACDAHPLFRQLSVSSSNSEKDDEDPCIYAMKYLTEEGQKVDRNHGSKFYAVYERIPFDTSTPLHAGNFFL
jgi:tRNA (guanine-N7-)-methyltransferase